LIKVCVTGVTAGGNEVLFNGIPNFWLGGSSILTDCGNNGLATTMQFTSVIFENGKSRGICNSELNEWFDLPQDYLLSEEFWGAVYYKSYGLLTAWVFARLKACDMWHVHCLQL